MLVNFVSAKMYATVFLVCLAVLPPLLGYCVTYEAAVLSVPQASKLFNTELAADTLYLVTGMFTASLGVLLTAVNVGLLFAVWRRCNSQTVSFFDGLETICRCQMSGCANLTAMYLFPSLTIVYLQAVFFTLMGLKRGKKYTEQKWRELVREHEFYSDSRRSMW